ncbi:MAG TPA: lactonase family protein [Streptosporangiaceae bacterium]|nr:lactonase family protein [Streptosporangiaceae bacterium]
MKLVIGTYTEDLPHVRGKALGIYGADFEAATGRIGPVCLLAAARNPSYLTASASGENLYAVTETLSLRDREGGGITAYARDRETGNLTRLNDRSSRGASPCHIAVDPSGRFVLTANYGADSGPGSVSVHRLAADGSLGDVTDHVQHAGSGPHPVRQAASHPHMTASDPRTGEVLVTDLGIDAVVVYSLDQAGRLTPKASARWVTAPGAGPRHVAFHPDAHHLFVVNELGNTVATLRRQAGRFEQVHCVSTLPPGVGSHGTAGAIRMSRSGRHVLVSNRGHDSVSVLRFSSATSSLSLTGTTASGGEQPRDLAVSPDGRHVVIANTCSGLVVSCGFDDRTGALRPLHSTAVPSPACLVFG